VTCWGRNPSGQLGTGDKTQPGHPVIALGLSGVTSVGVGWNFSCALDSSGNVWCWGDGVIGDNVQLALAPHKTKLPTGKATFLATGPETACALMDNQGAKSIWCWGTNANAGIAPLDAGAYFATPVKIALDASDADEVAIGEFAICVLHAGRTRLRCQGDNSRGIFSDFASTGDTLLPSSPIGALHMGEIHACDIDKDGNAACWGWNYFSAFGSTNQENVAPPLSLFAATAIAPAYQGTCAIVGGSVQCAGNNGHGAAGDGTTGGTKGWGYPVQDAQQKALDNVVDVTLHRQFACATQKNGRVSCWGQNRDGNDPTPGYWLGDGTTVLDRSYAAPVIWK